MIDHTDLLKLWSESTAFVADRGEENQNVLEYFNFHLRAAESTIA